MQILKATGMFAVAGLTAFGAAAFELGDGITADVTPDGGVTFRAGEANRSVKPADRRENEYERNETHVSCLLRAGLSASLCSSTSG